VVHDDGTVDRVELTGLVDQGTRTIAAAVLRPTTKAVDAALLLARALTPEPMRQSLPSSAGERPQALTGRAGRGGRRGSLRCAGARLRLA
jgi:hypothetical protein